MFKINSIEKRENFDLMCEMTRKVMELEKLNEEVLTDLSGIESEGFYCPLTEEVFNTIPMEERWYQKYYITYHMSELLLDYYLEGHDEVYEQLISTINACLSKEYTGHGYDALSIRLKYLIKLYEIGLQKLLDMAENNELSTKFNILIYLFRNMLASNNTKDGWGDLAKDITRLLKLVDKNVLFVYGTLMDGERNSYYLEECPFIGQGEVRGYQLLELNGYPGMIKGNNEVIGELYEIDEETKKDIDLLEGSQYKYSSDIVYVGNTCYYANFYEFIPEVDRRYISSICVENKWLNTKKYVWYACYGSNLLTERFNKYIERTTSKAKPVDSQAIILPYELYFAKNSSRWDNAGVAFIDTDKQDITYGWMYLITKEQFNEIQRMEGAWYKKKVFITTDEMGIDIVTFTSSERYEEVEPSKEYVNVIKRGLKEKYKLSDSEIFEYLGK